MAVEEKGVSPPGSFENPDRIASSLRDRLLDGLETIKLIIPLKKVLAKETGSDLKLKQDDYLFVRAVPEWRLFRTVSITGEV
ncbi:MAG: hypothetical protein IH919_04330, partial [Deltaproteobacteria bacterium]|nr:hypothetical protein [Deltaproteobacteria bacterium]